MRGNGIWRFLSAAALFGFALGLVLIPEQAASESSQGANPPQSAADEPVPAYHAQAPQGALPATMNPEFFPDPVVQNAYAIAAKIKKTLYQQPCYCHCDRSPDSSRHHQRRLAVGGPHQVPTTAAREVSRTLSSIVLVEDFEEAS